MIHAKFKTDGESPGAVVYQSFLVILLLESKKMLDVRVHNYIILPHLNICSVAEKLSQNEKISVQLVLEY